MSIVKKELSISMFVLATALLITAAISWYASKNFYDIQRERQKQSQTWLNIVSTAVAIFILHYLRKAWNAYMKARDPNYENVPIFRTEGTPLDRARDSMKK